MAVDECYICGSLECERREELISENDIERIERISIFCPTHDLIKTSLIIKRKEVKQ
jgi:hypothetical protein